MACEVDPVERRLVQRALEPRRELDRGNGGPAPGKVDRVDAPHPREALEHGRPPAPRACEPMHQDERLAAADDHLALSLHAKRTMPRGLQGGNLPA